MAKAFAVFLQEINDGRVHSRLTERLDALLHAVRDTGKAGSVTVTIKVKPATRSSGVVDKVTLKGEVKADLPQNDAGEDFFWMTEDAELSRNHPRQSSLELREAPRAAIGDLKEV